MSQRPVATGLQFCQQTIVEEGTRYVTLVNCFHRLWVEQFPSAPQSLTVCCMLTDGTGEIDLTLEIMDLDSGELISSHTRRSNFHHPLAKVWYYGRLRRFVFPTEGRFQFTLLANGEWVAQGTLEVLRKGAHP